MGAVPATAAEAVAQIRSLAAQLTSSEPTRSEPTTAGSFVAPDRAAVSERTAAGPTDTGPTDTNVSAADAAAATASRARAERELRALLDAVRNAPADAPLRATTIDIGIGPHQERLELLMLPSIFAPEDWAFTFLEGLLKTPVEEFAGRSLVELGTGSGWICIALAKFTRLARIFGVDLNPHAVPLAICNACLNGIDGIGERVVFGESDLLEQLPSELRFDFVVGCIPQVLREETPEAPSDDERRLYDLSNYCAIQNVYEDHFGLGLIARLLDEVPEHLAEGGRLLLNLAGRPGRGIIDQMFSRRGFRTHVVFSRRVRQASDTDIAPLVELEALTRREFEFYLDAHSAKPVCAATAAGWLGAGHPIWHEVAVWRAEPVQLRETLRLRQGLRSLGIERILREIDLGQVSAEQLDFVVALLEQLRDTPRLPYPELAGDRSFRNEIARYLLRFFELDLHPDEIFVAPEREQAVYSLVLATCDPGDRVLISSNLKQRYAAALEKAQVGTVVGNTSLHELGQLLEAFDVRVALIALEAEERSNLSELRAILELARARETWVVIDESAALNITSGVETQTLLEFLSREQRHANLVVLYGLIKNAVFVDFELTLLLPTPPRLRRALGHAAELTYSRIATLPQLFYQQLFESLLSFRVSFSQPRAVKATSTSSAELPCSRRMDGWAEFAGLAPAWFDRDDPELIRMDYGENESQIPALLVEGLIAGCIQAPAPGPPKISELREAIAGCLLETRGLRYAADEIALGAGAWPLLHDLALTACRRLGRPARFLVLTPCYGLTEPTLRAAGALVELASIADFAVAAARTSPDVIALCQPQNPLGTYHSRENLLELASYVVAHRCWLLSDEVFGLLNLTDVHSELVPSPIGLESAVPGIAERTLILGSLSKEFAAGGLRVGWLAMRDRDWLAAVGASALVRIHEASAHAAAHLYSAYARGPKGKLLQPERHRELRGYLSSMRRELARRRAALLEVLPGSDDPAPGTAGGLFLAPSIADWLGNEVDGQPLTPENFARSLYQHTHVVVNDGAWCSDPERIRAVFSIAEERFERALERLRQFAETHIRKA